jgi:hypothetical protein
MAVTSSSLKERLIVTALTWSERSTEFTFTPTLLFKNTLMAYSSSFLVDFGFSDCGAICPTFSSQALSSEGTSYSICYSQLVIADTLIVAVSISCASANTAGADTLETLSFKDEAANFRNTPVTISSNWIKPP